MEYEKSKSASIIGGLPLVVLAVVLLLKVGNKLD